MANENMDMKRMQEEAIHRVQEMQNRANQQLRGTPSFAASPRTNRSNNGPSFSSGTHGNHTEEPAHHTPNEQGGPLHGHNGGSLPSAPPRLCRTTEHCGKFIRRSYERQRTNFNHDTAAGTV